MFCLLLNSKIQKFIAKTSDLATIFEWGRKTRKYYLSIIQETLNNFLTNTFFEGWLGRCSLCQGRQEEGAVCHKTSTIINECQNFHSLLRYIQGTSRKEQPTMVLECLKIKLPQNTLLSAPSI